IVGHGVHTYARTVAIAQAVDASIRREATQTQAQPVAQPPAQSKVAQPSTNKNKRKFKGGPDDRRNRQRRKSIPECPTCGKHHRGECLVGQNICFFSTSQAISAPTVQNDCNNNRNNVNHHSNFNNNSPGSSHHDPNNSHAADTRPASL
ncbi:Unknown protein, partial [Striga hermonthica]